MRIIHISPMTESPHSNVTLSSISSPPHRAPGEPVEGSVVFGKDDQEVCWASCALWRATEEGWMCLAVSDQGTNVKRFLEKHPVKGRASRVALSIILCRFFTLITHTNACTYKHTHTHT